MEVRLNLKRASIQCCLAPLIECDHADIYLSMTTILCPALRPLTDLPSILLQLERLCSDEGGVCLNVNFKVTGKSSLHLACEANNEKSFTALLNMGADIMATLEIDAGLYCTLMPV